MGRAAGAHRRKRKNAAEDTTRLPQSYRAALALFGLDEGTTLKAVKARYKILVKSHHPDANGGDTRASRRLVRINEAYEMLAAFFGKG